MGLPPQGSPPSTPIETGVYLRMGTYVDDLAHPVDEFSRMPIGYRSLYSDAIASEGIFITTAGVYIVIGLDEAYFEIEDGLGLSITSDDGSMTTTVKQGDVEIAIENGVVRTIGSEKKGAVYIEGHKAFDVTSDAGNIGVAAKKGKVSSKGDYIYTHTYGSYYKLANASKKSGTHGADTNVSIALNMSFYGAVLFSAKMLTISVKLASITAPLLQMSVNAVLAIDFNGEARAYVAEDAKFAWLYIKYRGIQLESDKTKTSAAGLKNKAGLVSLRTGLSKANASPLMASFGLVSKIPGV
jgi:hypothetical protein